VIHKVDHFALERRAKQSTFQKKSSSHRLSMACEQSLETDYFALVRPAIWYDLLTFVKKSTIWTNLSVCVGQIVTLRVSASAPLKIH